MAPQRNRLSLLIDVLAHHSSILTLPRQHYTLPELRLLQCRSRIHGNPRGLSHERLARRGCNANAEPLRGRAGGLYWDPMVDRESKFSIGALGILYGDIGGGMDSSAKVKGR